MSKAPNSIERMSGAELVALYNSLTGESLKRFETLEAGRARCAALLTKRRVEPQAVAVPQPQAVAVQPSPPQKSRGVAGFNAAIACGDGRTVLQKDSIRRKIFEWLAAQGSSPISVKELDAHFDCKTRPHLLKLRDAGHVILVTDE